MISDRGRSVWAKSSPTGQSLSLLQHLTDSAGTAGHLLLSWTAPSVLRRIGQDLPRGADDALLLIRWLAGVHDIGKATAAFACAVPALAVPMAAQGLRIDQRAKPLRGRLPHSVAGHVVLRDWLTTRHAFAHATATSYAVVVGAHHGHAPTNDQIAGARAGGVGYGDQAWHDVRHELLEHLAHQTGAHERLEAWSQHPLSDSSQALATGLVIMSDWIASNEELFPLREETEDDARSTRAWQRLNLPEPWRPAYPAGGVDGLLQERFGLPATATVRPLQVEAVHCSSTGTCMLIEASPGEGKTEAALLVAERWAARHGCNGLFFALPTRATSDGIYPRLLQWVQKLPPPDSGRPWSTFLAHSKAGLNDDWSGLVRTAPISMGDSPHDRHTAADAAVAHSWLSGRKKGPLSTFVVGTVDQALFAGLRSRHVMLRHLALASKVVVVDEAHASDDFMRVYLERALEWFGAYETPVVILSATLPASQSDSLLQAYERGLGLEPSGEPLSLPAYPRITTTGRGGRAARSVAASGRRTEIAVSCAVDDLEGLPMLVDALRPQDGVVAVIRNTVRRAQVAFDILREAYPADEVLLLHSRLLAHERSRRERVLRDWLGPPDPHRARPRRLIVVGTQVLEQSLDIDVDVMLTDLAPVDLILQRLGRLHRHERQRPPGLESARCVLTGADWQPGPPSPDRGSVHVYGLSSLLRSAAVLQDHLAGRALQIPEDIDHLVQSAYADTPPSVPGWEQALATADLDATDRRIRRQEDAKAFRLPAPGARDLRSWSEFTSTADEDAPAGQAAVRDGVGGVEVLLLPERDEAFVIPTLDGSGTHLLEPGAEPDDGAARAAARWSISLPDYVRPDALDALVPAAWRRSRWVRGVPVVPLDHSGLARIPGFALGYDEDRGLTVTKETR